MVLLVDEETRQQLRAAKAQYEAERNAELRKNLKPIPGFGNSQGSRMVDRLLNRQMAQQDIKPASLVRRHTFVMPPPQLKSRNFPENELQMKIHDANVNAQRPNPLDPQK